MVQNSKNSRLEQAEIVKIDPYFNANFVRYKIYWATNF